MLDAMNMLVSMWNTVLAETIVNCFRKARTRGVFKTLSNI